MCLCKTSYGYALERREGSEAAIAGNEGDGGDEANNEDEEVEVR